MSIKMGLLLVVPTLVWMPITLGGDLNPPAGVPAPTFKTLHEVEPRTIVNDANTPGDATAKFIIKLPGSYYLTSNLLAEDGKDGIRIESSGVTLDLMGFELIGLVFDGRSLTGIHVVQEVATNLVIRNGSIRNWGGAGIDAAVAVSGVIEDIVCGPNSGIGIIAGDHSRVSRCLARENDAGGIQLGRWCLADHCIANMNLLRGFVIGDQSLVIDCQASFNGDDGFNAGDGVRIERCLASVNGSNGIEVDERCTVIGCTIDWNDMTGLATDQNWCRFLNNQISRHNFQGSHGIFISGSQSVVDGNHISESNDGIFISTGTDNFIVRNRFMGVVTPVNVPAGNDDAPVRTTFVGAGPWDNFDN